MKKKLVTGALLVAFGAVAVTSGTLAYFTDTDEAVNTFTVGNVDIALHEANEDGSKVDEKYQEWLKDQKLMPGDKNTNNIAKRVYVANEGNSDAYVRVHIAIPSVLDDAQPNFDASKNLLHFNAMENVLGQGQWNWGKKLATQPGDFVSNGDEFNAYNVKIGDIDYNVYVVTYETALEAASKDADGNVVLDQTPDAMYQVYLYKDTTNEDIEKANETLKGDWNIRVIAEAGQTDGFDNAYEALNTQFGTPGAENYKSPFAAE